MKPLRALRAYSDKQEFYAWGEVEYGRPFPLSEIMNHLQGIEYLADSNLLTLVALADRDKCELLSHGESSFSTDLLTKAELDLHHHICVQHKKLVNRFICC